MSINLRKGQKIDLSKDSNLKNLLVGLGWDCKDEKKSFFGLFKNEYDFDCDASVFMLDENRQLKNSKDLIYFGNLQSRCGSIRHGGDNLTGEGDGDDESIIVDLHKVPEYVHELFFVVNIYQARERRQHFGMIENAFIRVCDDNKELLRYDLSEDYSDKTAIIVAKIYRYKDNWKFAAIGQGTEDGNLDELENRLTSGKKVLV